jgi:hypothetical protein
LASIGTEQRLAGAGLGPPQTSRPVSATGIAFVCIANGAVNPAAANPMSTSVGTPMSMNAVGMYASGSIVMVEVSAGVRAGLGVGLRRRRRGAPGGRECSDMSSMEGTAVSSSSRAMRDRLASIIEGCHIATVVRDGQRDNP